MHFANQALFIAIATMLWAFDIGAPIDENGSMVTPDPDAFKDVGVVV